MKLTLILGMTLVASSFAFGAAPTKTVASVEATVESQPVDTHDDAADDPAIWIDSGDPSRSVIIGTDKKAGLAVYTLDGKQHQFMPGFLPNNVDLRQGVRWGDVAVDLVVASDRKDNSVAVFTLDAATRTLKAKSVGKLHVPYEPYGLCLFVSPKDGACYVFLTNKNGLVEQFRLSPAGDGASMVSVRKIQLAGQTEGCVADDARALLYVGEEVGTLWRIRAEADAPEERLKLDAVQPDGRLSADIEGLALYTPADGTQYLVASSQGDSTFAVYATGDAPRYVGSFQVQASASIDAVSGTDGIEVSNVVLPGFAMGVFVCQDDENDSGTQNFKLVPWASIVSALGTAMQP